MPFIKMLSTIYESKVLKSQKAYKEGAKKDKTAKRDKTAKKVTNKAANAYCYLL